MRVLVNEISTWDGAKTGVGYYTTGLIDGLGGRGDLELAHYPPRWLGLTLATWKRGRRWLPSRRGSSAALLTSEAQPSLKHRLLQRHFQRYSRQGKFDLYHEPNFIPFKCDLPTVVTIHDLSVLRHPEWHPIERVRHYEQRFQRGLADCAHILTVSDFTRREVIATLGQRPERVTRSYNGVRSGMKKLPEDAVRRTIHRLGLPPRYLLHVGTIEPRKNLAMLVQAFGSLTARVRESCPLVLVGGWGWNHQDIGRLLEIAGPCLGVRHVGYLPERDLPAVYNGATALVFPSFYEGFGLPVVEMMACGGAVIASTAGVMPELMGLQAPLIDPLDINGWREAMIRVVTDADWREQLRDGVIERASQFTWHGCAEETVKAYRAALAPRVPLRRAGWLEAGKRPA